MKKYFSLLLIIVMVLTLCSCGQKQSGTITTTNPETVTDPTVSITDGVEVSLKGEYSFISGNVNNEYDVLGYYENLEEGKEFKAVGLYSWQKTASLREEAEIAIKHDLPNNYEEITLIENDFWKKRGDCHYLCFTFFDEITFDEPTYAQSFFFEEEDLIKQFIIWYNVKPVTIPGMDIECYIPSYGKEVELTQENIDNNMFASYTFPDSFFADVSFYAWDRNGYSIEDTIEWYEKNTKNYEIIDQYEYKSKETGKTYECIEIGSDDDFYGEPCACLELNVFGEDKMFSLYFHTPEELADEYLASTGFAMMYGVKKAK